MLETTANNKRIAKNTLMLYFRMLLTLIVGLYTSRVVLRTLGVSDYGLYNVVGGIVTLFTFLNSTLATGTQRFLTYTLGENDESRMNKVFSTAFRLHLLFSVIFFVVAEIGGLWFIEFKMQIPAGRMPAAFWVYHFSIITAMLSIIQVPYQSSIIAHEKMDIYAYVSIYDVLMKLLIVYLIQVASYDKLIFYAFLILLIQISNGLLYMCYCYRHFDESRHLRTFDLPTFKEITAFSGWNVFGCAAAAFEGQGVNMLLNMFFGTTVNAARAIAFQVSNMIMQFVSNFQTAVNPQIVKLYASGHKEEMIELVINNSKFAAYLLLIISIPFFVEIEFILSIWLGEYPDYSPIFLRIIIIQILIRTITQPTITAVHAVGRMKLINLTAGTTLLMIVPVSYLLLKLGNSPEVIMMVNIIPWILHLFYELFCLHKYIGFPLLAFYRKVYCAVFPLGLLMLTIPYSVKIIFFETDGWLCFLSVCFSSIVSSILLVMYLGISKALREQIVHKFLTKVGEMTNIRN